MSEDLSPGLQTALVFAARYTHNRATAGAHVIIETIQHEWPRLSQRTRDQLARESNEATENKGDWREFRQAVVPGLCADCSMATHNCLCSHGDSHDNCLEEPC